MKIIIVNNKFYKRGGPETYMFNFMALAEKYGHSVIPFTQKDYKNLESSYSDYFVPHPLTHEMNRLQKVPGVFTGVKNAFFNENAYQNMRQLIKNEKPDLIYIIIQINGLSPSVIKAAKDEGIPVIHRFSDFFMVCAKYSLFKNGEICELCLQGDNKYAVKNKCSKNSRVVSYLRKSSMEYHTRKRFYDGVNVFISPSLHTKSIFTRSGRLNDKQIEHNPSFIDATDIIPCFENEGYVLCLGRFSPEKGFIYVVEALTKLRDIPVTVVVTGKREEAPSELISYIRSNQLEHKVVFSGFLHGKELSDLIDGAMCVACPAIWYDNMPNVVLESYAHGKPVIASNLGSLAEIVDDKKTGLLFGLKNVDEIAGCIRKLYTEPELVTQMGKNARKKVEDYYSPEKHLTRFIEICRTIGVANTEVFK